MADYKVSIGAELDGSLDSIQSKLESWEKSGLKIKLDPTEANKSISEVKSKLEALSKQKISIKISNGNGNGNSKSGSVNSIAKDYETSFSRIQTLSKELLSMQKQLGKADVGSNLFKTLQGQSTKIATEIKDIKKNAQSLYGGITKGQQLKLDDGIAQASRQLDQISASFKDKAQAKFNSIGEGFNTNKYASQMKSFEERLSSFGSKSIESKKTMQELRTTYTELQNAFASNDIDKTLSSFEKFNSLSDKMKNTLSLNKFSNAEDVDRIANKIERLNKLQSELHNKKMSFGDIADSSEISKTVSEIETLEKAIEKEQAILNGSNKERKWSSSQKTAFDDLVNNNKIAQAEQAYKKLSSLQQKINSEEAKLKQIELGKGKSSNSYKVQLDSLNKLKTQYTELFSTIDKFGIKLNQSQLNGLNNLKIDTSGIEKVKAQFKDGLNLGKIESDFNSLKSKADSLTPNLKKAGLSSAELKAKILELATAYKEFETAVSSGDASKIADSQRKLEAAFKSTSNQLNKDSASYKKYTQSVKEAEQAQLVLTKSNTLSNNISNWMTKNTVAAKKYRSELEQLQKSLRTNTDSSVLKQANAQFANIKSASLAFTKVKDIGNSVKNIAMQAAGLYGSYMVVQKAVRTFKDMANNVLLVDTAMTELYRVTDLSSAQYDNLYSKMSNSAQEYDVALNDIINSTANWVRLGFDADTSSRLSEITAMYQHVTDLDEDTAVKNLVTAYKGFQEQLLETNNGDSAAAIQNVADIYDKLGNEFSESAADVGEGLARSASVLQEGGATIQEAAGMFTGANEVIQNPETAGNSLKILTLRIRGILSCLHTRKVCMLCYG